MSETRAERVRRIRDTLECGMHRAVEIERGVHVVGMIERAKAFGGNADLCDAMREMALDQYRIRDTDMMNRIKR
ncbi:hypothetical protein ACQR1W_17805 [Bradyrhizobium sp. HKCCYLS1011]|uniref:hypothetical protein n=1 Tax=Bradyrhizobium sp. HKCCYLS1011 TaxID=3420733 RepID=UPI003EBF739E